MLDGGRVVGGFAIILVVVAGPAWLGSVHGVKVEALAKPTAGERCIEPQAEMRKNHPALLASWRDRVVRLGDRVHEEGNGRTARISLTGTCLGCHGKASEFCDKCHAQAAVTVSCWQCHDKERKWPPQDAENIESGREGEGFRRRIGRISQPKGESNHE